MVLETRQIIVNKIKQSSKINEWAYHRAFEHREASPCMSVQLGQQEAYTSTANKLCIIESLAYVLQKTSNTHPVEHQINVPVHKQIKTM